MTLESTAQTQSPAHLLLHPGLIFGSRSKARAIAIRWRSPPDKRTPLSPSCVKALRQVLDKFQGISESSCLPNNFIYRFQTIGNITNRSVENESILTDDSQQLGSWAQTLADQLHQWESYLGWDRRIGELYLLALFCQHRKLQLVPSSAHLMVSECYVTPVR